MCIVVVPIWRLRLQEWKLSVLHYSNATTCISKPPYVPYQQAICGASLPMYAVSVVYIYSCYCQFHSLTSHCSRYSFSDQAHTLSYSWMPVLYYSQEFYITYQHRFWGTATLVHAVIRRYYTQSTTSLILRVLPPSKVLSQAKWTQLACAHWWQPLQLLSA